MPHGLNLSSSWAKLDRAKQHVDTLRSSIVTAAGVRTLNAIPVPLRRHYQADQGAVLYRIDRVIEIGEDWSLLAGDAIQNLRAALDHLMYELAMTYLARVPTEAEVKQIQFPDIRKLKQITGHRFLRYIRASDIDRIKPFMPYYRRHRFKKGAMHPLPKLIHLSNVDKHRRLHLLVVVPTSASFTNRGAGSYRDCVPIVFRGTDGLTTGPRWVHTAPRRPPRPNDEVLRVFVRPTGPTPDVDVNASLTCQIRLGRLGPVVAMLDSFGEYVSAVLTAFQPAR